MTHITVGDRRYRLLTTERDGRWTARAERDDTGDPFGIECAGDSEPEATARLTRWLEWQGEHTAALEELQRAERAYHRTIAGSALGPSVGLANALKMQKESLDAVETARVRLDDVRARKPE